MHKTSGLRDPAAAFPLPAARDDAGDRRAASRAVAVSAAGLGATGLAELLLAVLTGSVGLLGDAIHNLSDVSTSAVVFLGFRLSRRPATERYPYGLERAEDLAGIGIAAVICHVGYQVTADVVHRLADGVDPSVITTAETAAGSVPGVQHAHARARWTGRTLRVEIEGWVDPGLPARDADAIGHRDTPRLASRDGDEPSQCTRRRQRIEPGVPGVGDQRGGVDAPADDEFVAGHGQVADDADDRPGDTRTDVRGGAVHQ